MKTYDEIFGGPSLETMHLISKIAKRAVEFAAKDDDKIDFISLDMDITAAHNHCPLKLTELLEANEFNFCHDVFGIRNHINRDTGELQNCFLPRYAA